MTNIKNNYKTHYLSNKLELIYRTSIFEGLATTRLETSQIIEFGKVKGASFNDTQIVVNIYNAWQKMMREEYIGNEEDVLIELNRELKKGMPDSKLTGKVREHNLKISGTTYKPPSYKRYNLEGMLMRLLGVLEHNTVDSILYVYLHLMRTQFFVDGNKRTSYLFTNWVLMTRDHGYILYLPSETSEREYLKRLKSFYENPKGNEKEMIQYIKHYYLKKV